MNIRGIDYSFEACAMDTRVATTRRREKRKKKKDGNEKWKSLKGEKVISQMNLIQLMKAATTAVVLLVGFFARRWLSIRMGYVWWIK
jgi:hypothetical protein